MNSQLFSLGLFLLWFGVALTALLIGPIFFPRMFGDTEYMRPVGGFAALLAIWNLVKWWSIRQYSRRRAFRDEMEEAYRRRVNPPGQEREKPILHPEFQFEDEPHRLPPPPPPNGTTH